jgi:UDP-3-O-[3-hydroxymyristoyl] glucosamine N-acyltransferase
MKFTVGQIAQVLGGTVEGDAAAAVTGLAKIEEAGPGSLAFLANAKYEPFLYTTGATAVIISPELVLRQPVAAALIRVAEPYLAFTKLLEFYQQATRTARRGVEQPAFIGASSTIGDGHYRGAFSYWAKTC